MIDIGRRKIVTALGGVAAGWPVAAYSQSERASDADPELARVRTARRILLKGGVVLTVDPQIGDFASGDILIEDGKIRDVITEYELPRLEPATHDVSAMRRQPSGPSTTRAGSCAFNRWTKLDTAKPSLTGRFTMTHETQSSRRTFLGVLGAGVAAAGAGAAPGETAAQPAMPARIIDFHNHYMGPSWTLTNLASLPPPARAAWERINANLQSPTALIGSVESASIAARVINTPTAFIEDADGKVAPDAIRRINDQMAELVDKQAGRLYGLATIDAFAGDDGAREVTRAVRELRLRGVFLESAKRDLVLGDRETRPTLAAAAALDVPVFVHPLTDPQLDKRFARSGRLGVRFARGTINSAALINMLEGGTFDEIPNLKVVVTTLAFGGLMLAAGFGDGQRIRSDAPALARRHVYIDTMGIHPAVIRTAIDLLGADHVVVGTDWPIAVEAAVPERLEKAFAHAGLSAAEQEMIASGNTMRLLKIA